MSLQQTSTLNQVQARISLKVLLTGLPNFINSTPDKHRMDTNNLCLRG